MYSYDDQARGRFDDEVYEDGGGFRWTQWVTDSLTALDKTAAKSWVPAVDQLVKTSKRAIEEEWNAQFPPDDVYAREFSKNIHYPSELRAGAEGYAAPLPGVLVPSPERDKHKGGKKA